MSETFYTIRTHSFDTSHDVKHFRKEEDAIQEILLREGDGKIILNQFADKGDIKDDMIYAVQTVDCEADDVNQFLYYKTRANAIKQFKKIVKEYRHNNVHCIISDNGNYCDIGNDDFIEIVDHHLS